MSKPCRSLALIYHMNNLIKSHETHEFKGASVAKWLAHLPFTSEAAGSSLSENFLNATRTQSSCEKSKKVNALPQVVGFLGGLGKTGPQ